MPDSYKYIVNLGNKDNGSRVMELSKEDIHSVGQLQGRENMAVSDDRLISSKSTNYLYV